MNRGWGDVRKILSAYDSGRGRHWKGE